MKFIMESNFAQEFTVEIALFVWGRSHDVAQASNLKSFSLQSPGLQDSCHYPGFSANILKIVIWSSGCCVHVVYSSTK